MKSKMMKKANRKLRKAKMKGNLLMEMGACRARGDPAV